MSFYPWKGKISDEKEYILTANEESRKVLTGRKVFIAKTVEENFEKVKNEIEKIHSYTTPCIIKIAVSANAKYFQWLKSQLI